MTGDVAIEADQSGILTVTEHGATIGTVDKLNDGGWLATLNDGGEYRARRLDTLSIIIGRSTPNDRRIRAQRAAQQRSDL